MKRLIRTAIFLSVLGMLLLSGVVVNAEEKPVKKEGAYQVVEGKVSSIKARILAIDDQQYPISIYARVFNGENGNREMRLQELVNVGRIERAKLFLLGGKVEKIVVLKTL